MSMMWGHIPGVSFFPDAPQVREGSPVNDHRGYVNVKYNNLLHCVYSYYLFISTSPPWLFLLTSTQTSLISTSYSQFWSHTRSIVQVSGRFHTFFLPAALRKREKRLNHSHHLSCLLSSPASPHPWGCLRSKFNKQPAKKETFTSSF